MSPIISKLSFAKGFGRRRVGAGREPNENFWIGTLTNTSAPNTATSGYGINVDSSGNVYITGTSEGDFFIAKYNILGILQWQRLLSGNNENIGYSAIDISGNIYVCGHTTAGGIGGSDAFLVKYNSSGVIQWQRSFGGTIADRGENITIDSSGNIYMVCLVTSVGPSYSGVLIKYDSSGTLLFQRQIVFGGAGSGGDTLSAVAVDNSGNIYCAGTVQSSGSGISDGLLVKFNSSGTLLWQIVQGGAGNDAFIGCNVDSSGNVYVTGYRDSSTTLIVDPWIVKFDSSGTVLWERTLGAPGSIEFFLGSKIDSGGNIYVVGQVKTTDDLVLAKYDSSGNLVLQRTLGTTGSDRGWSVTLNNIGHIFVSGYSVISPTTSALFAKLPDDGSLTGTYGPFTYEVSNFTSNTVSTTKLTSTYSSGTSSFTSNTPSLTDSAGTLMSVTYW